MTLVLKDPVTGKPYPTSTPNSRDPLSPVGSNPPAYGTPPIYAPQKTSLDQGYADIQKYLPNFTPIASTQASSLNPNTFGNLNGFDDNYYKTLSDQASKRLKEQYFSNNDSVLNQRSNELKRRGVFGDAIGENAINDVYKNFGSQLSDFASQLATTKAQNDLDLATKNRDFNFGIAKENQGTERFNIQNLLDASKFNTTTQNQLAELGLSGALDSAANSTKYDTSIFESAVNQKNSEGEQLNNRIQRLQAIANDTSLDQFTRNQARDQLLGLINL